MPNQETSTAPMSADARAPRRWISEALSFFALAILIVYAATRNLCQALTRPLWFDEIDTFILIRLQPMSRMWTALKHGADGQPPGFYLAERFAVAFAANENLAFRWLSMFAFSVTLVCLFLLVRRRAGGAAGVVCAAIPLSTILFDNFATEARPYSLVVGCIALALLCYQHAPAARWMILMGFSLALAQSFHYYAFFAFLPFMVAEAIWFLERREWRWRVWIALSFGFVPLLAFWPLLANAKAIYGQHFWSPPTWDMAVNSYSLFLMDSRLASWVILGASAVAVLGTALYGGRTATSNQRASDQALERSPGTSLQEPMMVLTFLALPFLGLAATRIAHGGLVPKYVLSTILGFPLAGGYIFSTWKRWRPALVAVGAFLIFGGFVFYHERIFWSQNNWKFSSPAPAAESFVALAGHPDLPVVVSDSHEFMLLSHYASPAWKARFVLLADGPQAVIYTGSDNADIQLSILAQYFPLPVYDFRSFVAQHPTFLLYSSNGGQDADWWPRRFKNDGYTLRPVAVKPLAERDFMNRVFLVTSAKKDDTGIHQAKN